MQEAVVMAVGLGRAETITRAVVGEPRSASKCSHCDGSGLRSAAFDCYGWPVFCSHCAKLTDSEQNRLFIVQLAIAAVVLGCVTVLLAWIV